MHLERYELVSEPSLTIFHFHSEGPKGSVKKLVQFAELLPRGYFNLAFGDYDPVTDYLRDDVITNNGDSQKVLATVAACVMAFTDIYPDAYIYAEGSSKSRTRLYQMGICNNFSSISPFFSIFALKDATWHPFQKGVNYEAFLVKRKRIETQTSLFP